MAKKEACGDSGCCPMTGCIWCGLIVLALGVLFLLRDLNVWNFWNIQWWTAAFLLMGLGCLCMCTMHPKKK
ncbi:hypothetical protein KY349_01515 [Candidatus Woesearchaeota archaeon]|jgi:hypothetical protein|nr:hypothetical protein [Candidatus Woesearchaeota archaeon]